MPVRVEPQVVREGINGKNFSLTKQQWEEHDSLITAIKNHNNQVKEEVEKLQKLITDKFSKEVKVVARAFSSLHEDSGKSLIVPRNYLSLEIIEVTTVTEKIKYLLVDNQDLNELSEQVINDLYVKERKKAEPTDDGKSSSDPTEGDGRKPRKSRLARYAEEVCKSLESIQPRKGIARRNLI